MRTVLIIVLLSVGCDDASSPEPIEPTASAEPQAAPASEEVAEPPSSGTAQPTTTGFIEARVDGEMKRFEHLVAAHNTAATNGTFLEATTSADDEEGIRFALGYADVRELDFPATIEHDVRTMRFASMTYRDPEGENHVLLLRGDDALRCQSLEALRLRCTFSGTAGDVEVADGTLDVQLTTNALRDRAFEAIQGGAPPPPR